MTPSLELRNMAALQHAAMEAADDAWRETNCRLFSQEDYDFADASESYNQFCEEHGFRLMTDASGLFLRCAETGIPLCVGDDTSELGDGELILVKQAA